MAATQMKSFVGKHRTLLERNGSKAVAQLASQEPDESVVHCAFEKGERSQRFLRWCNKPQQADPCIATLKHPEAVNALAVSATRVVGGVGKCVHIYDAATQEPLEELLGESEVNSIAIFEHDGQKGTGWIAVGYKNGTIQVWSAGV